MKDSIKKKYQGLKEFLINSIDKKVVDKPIPNVIADERGIAFLKNKTVKFTKEFHGESMNQILEDEFPNTTFTKEELEMSGDLHPKELYLLLLQGSAVFINPSLIDRDEYQKNPMAMYHGLGRLYIMDSIETLTDHQVKELLHYMDAFHCFNLLDIFVIPSNVKVKDKIYGRITLEYLEQELKNISYERMKVTYEQDKKR